MSLSEWVSDSPFLQLAHLRVFQSYSLIIKMMGTMLMMPFLAFPAVSPRLLWPQLAQEGWDASRKEPDGRWSDWKYSNLEAKNITSYIVQESSSLKLFAWLLKKPDCTLAKTQGEGVKKSIFAHLSLQWSIGWVALSFLLFVVCPAMVTSYQISTSTSLRPPNPYIFWKLMIIAIQKWIRNTNTKTKTNTKTMTKTKTRRE